MATNDCSRNKREMKSTPFPLRLSCPCNLLWRRMRQNWHCAGTGPGPRSPGIFYSYTLRTHSPCHWTEKSLGDAPGLLPWAGRQGGAKTNPMCSRRTVQSKFEELWTWINCCGLKPLKFGVVCYIAAKNPEQPLSCYTVAVLLHQWSAG